MRTKLIIKRFAQVVGIFMAIIFMIIGVIQIPSLKNSIVERCIALSLKETGQKVIIQNVSGVFPFHIKVQSATILDIEKTKWLNVQDFDLKTNVLKFIFGLKNGIIYLNNLTIGQINYLVNPVSPMVIEGVKNTNHSQTLNKQFEFPKIIIEKIDFKNINISNHIFDCPLQLNLEGSIKKEKSFWVAALKGQQNNKGEFQPFIDIEVKIPEILNSIQDIWINAALKEEGCGIITGLIDKFANKDFIYTEPNPKFALELNTQKDSRNHFRLKINLLSTQLGDAQLNTSIDELKLITQGYFNPRAKNNIGENIIFQSNLLFKKIIGFDEPFELEHFSLSSDKISIISRGFVNKIKNVFDGQINIKLDEMHSIPIINNYFDKGSLELNYKGEINYENLNCKGHINGKLDDSSTKISPLKHFLGSHASLSAFVENTRNSHSIQKLELLCKNKNKLVGDFLLDEKNDKISGDFSCYLMNPIKFTINPNQNGKASFKGRASFKCDGSLTNPNMHFEYMGSETILNNRNLQECNAKFDLNTIKGNHSLIGFVKLKDNKINCALNADIKDLEKDQFTINKLELTGPKTNIKISGRGTLIDKEFIGNITAKVDDFSLYEPWFGDQLTGQLDLVFNRESDNHIKLAAQGKKIFLPNINLDLLRANIDYNLKSKTGQAAVVLENLFAQGFHLKNAQLDAILKNGQGKIFFIGHNKEPQPWDCELDGILDIRDTYEFTLKKFNLEYAKHFMKVLSPCSIRISNNIKVDHLKISTYRVAKLDNKGFINLENFEWGDNYNGDLNIKNFELNFLSLLSKKINLRGELSGFSKLGGTKHAPQMESQFSIDTLKLAKTKDDLSSHLKLKVNLLNKNFSWDVNVKGKKHSAISSQGQISNLQGWEILPHSKINGQFLGNGDLSILNAFLATGDHYSGSFKTDINSSGTFHKPIIKGRLQIENGFYENFKFGTILKNLNANFHIDNNLLKVVNCQGTDQNSGQLKVNGQIHLMDFSKPNFGLILNTKNFILAANDGITASIDSQIQLKGLGKKAEISGKVSFSNSEISLGVFADDGIQKIQIKDEDGRPLNQSDAVLDTKPISNYFPINLIVSFPKTLKLKGFGLNSLWEGELKIINYLSQPNVIGRLSLIQGKADLFKNKLDLEKGGYVIFDNQVSNDPILNLKATRDINEIKAFVVIEGRASDIKIKFASSPALPQEEILSRLIFRKGRDKISMAQSILLANYIQDISRGGTGRSFFDQIENAMGVDLLQIKEVPTHNTDGENTVGHALSIGKRLSDKVFITWDQGVDKNASSKATLEVELSNQFRLEADVGGEKNTGIGLQWIKRY